MGILILLFKNAINTFYTFSYDYLLKRKILYYRIAWNISIGTYSWFYILGILFSLDIWSIRARFLWSSWPRYWALNHLSTQTTWGNFNLHKSFKGSYCISSNSSFIQYCDSNIRLFFIAPPLVIALPTLQKQSCCSYSLLKAIAKSKGKIIAPSCSWRR